MYGISLVCLCLGGGVSGGVVGGACVPVPLDLELQTAMSRHVGVGHRLQVLRSSSQGTN